MPSDTLGSLELGGAELEEGSEEELGSLELDGGGVLLLLGGVTAGTSITPTKTIVGIGRYLLVI